MVVSASGRRCLHEIPGGAFGKDLGDPVGIELRIGRVRPDRFIADASAPCGGRAAAAADVITTRVTPAFTAARSTRNVPSRAGTISASGSPDVSPPSGEAT